MTRNLPAWYRQFARWGFLPALAVVVWGELRPDTHGPEVVVWDKLLHFTAYFGLAGIATVAIHRLRPAVWTAACLAALGGILEIVQISVGRDAEWGDEFANIAGVCVGVFAAWQTVRAVRWLATNGRQ